VGRQENDISAIKSRPTAEPAQQAAALFDLLTAHVRAQPETPDRKRSTCHKLAALPLTLDLFPPNFLRVFAALFGLLWGSFLNVVIYRVPKGMSVVRPASHCPACGAPVRAWQNVPVLSYVFLRGKAGCCGARMSPRYPVVELIGGVLSLAIVELSVLPLPQATTSIAFAGALYASSFALAMALVATAFIDLEHMVVLPDKANFVLAVLGVATSSLRGLGWLDAVIGAAVGFGSVMLINGLYKLVRGRTGMASGDAVLLGVVGAWFGWQGALFGLMAGAVQGVIVIILVRLFGGAISEPEAVRKEREEILAEIEKLPDDEREEALEAWRKEDELADATGEGMQAALAFGPFIALAGLELLLFRNFLEDVVFLWQLG
jgi:leader peptidase (prepilin peptidase)/N-methyltransferase